MEALLQNAKQYCQSKELSIILQPMLGGGTDGSIWQSAEGTAVKAFQREKNYVAELECYRRLKANHVNEIMGFAIPELEGHSDELMVVEMTIVEPPFLLDFGKVYLDRSPPYFADQELMGTWLAESKELFEDDWSTVESLLYSLRQYGIYYVDPKPGNIRFRNE